jgi:hypothetical protein
MLLQVMGGFFIFGELVLHATLLGSAVPDDGADDDGEENENDASCDTKEGVVGPRPLKGD